MRASLELIVRIHRRARWPRRSVIVRGSVATRLFPFLDLKRQRPRVTTGIRLGARLRRRGSGLGGALGARLQRLPLRPERREVLPGRHRVAVSSQRAHERLRGFVVRPDAGVVYLVHEPDAFLILDDLRLQGLDDFLGVIQERGLPRLPPRPARRTRRALVEPARIASAAAARSPHYAAKVPGSGRGRVLRPRGRRPPDGTVVRPFQRSAMHQGPVGVQLHIRDVHEMHLQPFLRLPALRSLALERRESLRRGGEGRGRQVPSIECYRGEKAGRRIGRKFETCNSEGSARTDRKPPP